MTAVGGSGEPFVDWPSSSTTNSPAAQSSLRVVCRVHTQRPAVRACHLLPVTPAGTRSGSVCLLCQRASMRLRVALLLLSQAQSALPFVHPQAFRVGDADARAPPSSSNPSVRMVASVPTSTVTTHEVNGDAGQGGKQATSPGTLVVDQPEGLLRTVEMYDTTLRDGTQMEGISASVLDKLKIALQLHHFGRMSACRLRIHWKQGLLLFTDHHLVGTTTKVVG